MLPKAEKLIVSVKEYPEPIFADNKIVKTLCCHAPDVYAFWAFIHFG